MLIGLRLIIEKRMGYLHVMVFYSIMNLPVRGETFVTRKITRAVSRIALGIEDKIYLGNLDAKRDWGHAKDYVRVMWMILQYKKAEDWVIATGETTTVREFVRLAFGHVGIELDFKGEGKNEIGIIKKSSNPLYNLEIGKEVVAIDSRYYRPTEVDLLVGDSSKAYKKLGWKSKYNLKDIVDEMMLSDLNIVRSDQQRILNCSCL